MRFGNMSLLGEFNYIAVGDELNIPGSRRARMSRLGLLARYSILHTGEQRDATSNDFWLEAGLGRHQVAWNSGGTLTRNDAVLGFGYQFNGRIGRRGPNPHYFGPYFALRAHVSPAPTDASAVVWSRVVLYSVAIETSKRSSCAGAVQCASKSPKFGGM